MRAIASRIALISSLLALTGAASASADVTLGTTTQPAGSNGFACSNFLASPLMSDPTTTYAVPAGGGAITQWQTNTAGDVAGGQLAFVVMRASGSQYTIIGSSGIVRLPNPLPAGGIASFALHPAVAVGGGEVLGLVTDSNQACFWQGGATPGPDDVAALQPTSSNPSPAFAPGDTYKAVGELGAQNMLNLAATLVVQEDAGVTALAAPNATAGGRALLQATVANNGPSSDPITFTETLPAGLAVDAAVAGDGACSVQGQLVSCSVSGLGPGQSAPVDVVVTPASAGTYSASALVSTPVGVPDPNPANNSATMQLVVGPAGSQYCIVPDLRGVPTAAAKRLLRLARCTVGKIRRIQSRTVRKGVLIGTSPAPGIYQTGSTIALRVSSGRRTHRGH